MLHCIAVSTGCCTSVLYPFSTIIQVTEMENRSLITPRSSVPRHVRVPCQISLQQTLRDPSLSALSPKSLPEKTLQNQSSVYIRDFSLRPKLMLFSCRTAACFLLHSSPFFLFSLLTRPLSLYNRLVELGIMCYTFHLLYSCFFTLLILPLQPLLTSLPSF